MPMYTPGGAVYQVQFDPSFWQKAQAMIAAGTKFAVYYRSAMRASVTAAQKAAKAHAPVGQYDKGSGMSGGTLRRGIIGQVPSPLVGVVGVPASIPYGRRREFGFDNMTDSLGRTFKNGDPLYANTDKRAHMHYLHDGMEDALPVIQAAFATAAKLTVSSFNIP